MVLFITYFNNTQALLLLLASILLIISLFFQIKNREILAVSFLVLTGICIFSFSALLDPFLNLWDERFHALVAKNLMNHPLKPTLYDNPIVNMAYDSWDKFHIWVHKQPLFLWQIALSFKLFGISEFTLRLPNVILSSFFVLASYRVGKLLVNQRTGFITGILIISTTYITELVAGRQELDHNDLSFMAYISFSIWSYVEYYFSKNKNWIYLIGIFSGLAILCKWLVGLLIYFGWGILRIQQKKLKISENKDLLLSIFIALIIAIPWQILTFIWYPQETIQAYKFNALHFTIPLDGHEGTFWYHFDKFDIIYGALASFLIIPSLYVMYKAIKDKKLFYSLLSMVLVVYIFFSFAVTKMPSFTIVVSIIIFIALASLIDNFFVLLIQYIRAKWLLNFIFILAMLIIVFARIDINSLQDKHTTKNSGNYYTRMLINNKEIFKSLKLPNNTVLFNVKGRHYIEAMFYTGLPAYNFIPSLEQCNDLKTKGCIIAVFQSNNNEIPSYLKNDSTVKILNQQIEGFD